MVKFEEKHRNDQKYSGKLNWLRNIFDTQLFVMTLMTATRLFVSHYEALPFPFSTMSSAATGRLQVCGRDAPLLLPGRLQLDAVGRGAAVPHGGAGVQHHHPAPLLIPCRLRNAPRHRHHLRHHPAERIRHQRAVSVTVRC